MKYKARKGAVDAPYLFYKGSSGRRPETSSGKFDYETWNPLWNKRVNTYTNEFDYNVTGKILRKNQQNTGLIADTNTTETIAETTYDWTYEYTGAHPNAVTKAGTRTMAYDLNGNMTTMADTAKNVTRTLTWNEENRLKQTTDASTTLSTGTSGTNSIVTTYEYDAAGTRVLKKGKYGTVQYVSDNYTVRNKDLISKHVFAGNTRLVSKVVMNEEKSGKMVATEQGSYYYHADHLGSSSVVTDGSGKFYEQIEYFPYGETWVHNKASSTQTSTPYKFTSKEQDEETGLYYYGARYYDAKLSRWVSADPAILKGRYFPKPKDFDTEHDYQWDATHNDDEKLPGMGGVFKSINLDAYHYAGNNPVKLVDPDGNITIAIELDSNDPYGAIAIQLFEGKENFKHYNNWVTRGFGTKGNEVAIDSGYYHYTVDIWDKGNKPTSPRLLGKSNENMKGKDGTKGGFIKASEKNPEHHNKKVANGIRLHRMREPKNLKKNDLNHGGKNYAGSEGCHGPSNTKDWNNFMEDKKNGTEGDYLLIRIPINADPNTLPVYNFK